MVPGAVRILFTIVGLLALAALGAGFLGRLHPAFDSLAHFRLHAIASVAVLAGLAALAGGRWMAVAGVAGVVLAGVTVAPYAAPFGAASRDAGATVTLLQMNLYFGADIGPAIATIEAADPQVVTLQEVTDAHWSRLERLDYPFRARCGTVALLSRLPFAGGTDVCLPSENLLVRAVALEGGVVNVGSQHLSWPWPYPQEAHIARLTETLRDVAAPAVLAGDFNAAPWSAAVRRYARAAGAEPVGGIGGTWPTGLPTALWHVAGLSLDNVLVTPGIDACAATLPSTGSDHAPVLVRLALPH